MDETRTNENITSDHFSVLWPFTSLAVTKEKKRETFLPLKTLKTTLYLSSQLIIFDK